MFLAEHVPKILDVRVAGINEGFAAVFTARAEGVVGVAVAGDEVVAGMQLPLHPMIIPRQQAEAERFRTKGAEGAGGGVGGEADPAGSTALSAETPEVPRRVPRARRRNCPRASKARA